MSTYRTSEDVTWRTTGTPRRGLEILVQTEHVVVLLRAEPVRIWQLIVQVLPDYHYAVLIDPGEHITSLWLEGQKANGIQHCPRIASLTCR